jgi:hypothetical protein
MMLPLKVVALTNALPSPTVARTERRGPRRLASLSV